VYTSSFFTHLGEISFSWDQSQQLTSVRWFEESDPSLISTAVGDRPAFIDDLVDGLRAFVKFGRPVPKLKNDWVNWDGVSEFRRKVYEAISEIPYGETRTYQWVAEKIAQPRSCRAVGQALRRNPFLIFIPCHRVISSSGDRGGFMGISDPQSSELKLKNKMLDLESQYLNPVFPFLKSYFSTEMILR